MNPLAEAAAGRGVVLAHDWLTGMRGGERVLELLCEAFPDAPLATLLRRPGAVTPVIENRPIATSWMQHLPAIATHYRYWLPLMPLAARTLRVPAGELLISCSHCVAKSFRKPAGARHICYCFTPMRYAWTFPGEYFGRDRWRQQLLKPLLAALRRWDRRTAGGVDRFVAISRHVADRIRRHYGRDCDIVYPPVDVSRCTPSERPGDAAGRYDLIVSALVPYKRIDLAVETYSRRGWPLKIVGVGGSMDRLKRQSGPGIEWLGWRTDAEIVELYRGCRLLVFPGEEDFGIVPLEAQACGRPVVAYAKGGALETVVENVSGVFFDRQTEESLGAAVERAAAHPWDPRAIRAQALRFGPERFIGELAAVIDRQAR